MSIAFEGPGGWIHGKTISEDGTVNFLSVSSLKKAELCLRRWLYHYKFGIKEPDTDDTKRGKELHSQVAGYLTTGSRAGLASQIITGIPLLEPPGPDLLVEHDLLLRPGPKLEFTRENSDALLAQAPLRAGGIPVTGAIDLMHARGTNRGGSDIEDTNDPPGTIEICDHKFPKRMKYAKAPQDLVTDFQTAGYGVYAFNVVPEAEWVRLSHLYMPSSGSPRKSTIRVRREAVEESWEAANSLAGFIVDAAREPDVDKVDANLNSCMAFGKECPAKSVCKAGMHNSLASMFGPTAAAGLLQDQTMQTTVVPPSSLLAKIQAAKAAQAAQAAPAPADMTQELLRLAQQEAMAKYPSLAKALKEIEDLGLGMVTFKGEAAKLVAALQGFTLIGDTINGTGEMAPVVIDAPALIFQILEEGREIAKSRGTAKEAPPSLLPPDAPPMDPALASRTPEVKAPPPPQTDAEAIASVAAATEPKKKGRPKKAVSAPEPEQVTLPGVFTETQYKADASKVVAHATATGTAIVAREDGSPRVVISIPTADLDASTAINLYVDCVVDGLECKSLWPIVEDMMDKLAERAGAVTKLEDGRTVVTDVRLADPNGPVGFGRWRPALAAFLRESGIAPGNYVLDGSFGELGQAVVEAMRPIVRKSGGVFVRGAR